MAKVQFSLKSTPKSKRHLTLDDCGGGDIVYLEEDNAFGIVSDDGCNEIEITHFSNGAREWYPCCTPCR